MEDIGADGVDDEDPELDNLVDTPPPPDLEVATLAACCCGASPDVDGDFCPVCEDKNSGNRASLTHRVPTLN
jgi:hypothetical protein